MKKVFKLFFKALSWVIIFFIILTLVISITKLSKPSRIEVDFSNMSDIQRQTFLRRYGGHLNVTNVSSIKDIKDDVIAYYKTLLKGELGWTFKIVRTIDKQGNYVSFRENIDPIGEILKTGFKRSIVLLCSALGIAITLGIIKGIFDSKKEKKNNSTFKLFTTVIGLSIPVIFLAPLLQIFVMKLGKIYGFKFPIQGHGTIKHMILPTIALAILPTMYIARLTAVSMDKAYEDEYVRTAISKGSSKLRVMLIHVFRNAIVEITGSLTSALTIVISDLALVEYLFNYKGLTYMMLEYYDQGQSDAVTGLALVLCAIFLFFYIFFKLLRFALDPNKGRALI